MGRIRSILPEIVTDAKFAALSDGAARLCYGLLSIVDDYGRCSASSSFLAGAIFHTKQRPLNSITKLVKEIADAGLIRLYEANGAQYLEIDGFQAPPASSKLARSILSQRIDRPQGSQFPAPAWSLSSSGSSSAPDPDLQSPITTSDRDQRVGREEEEEEDRSRKSAPVARGLMPRPGGRAEELETKLRERGDDVDAIKKRCEGWYRKKGRTIRDADAVLEKWYERELAGERKSPRSRSRDVDVDDDYGSLEDLA